MEVNGGEFRRARRALVAALVLSAALTAAAVAAEPGQDKTPTGATGQWTISV